MQNFLKTNTKLVLQDKIKCGKTEKIHTLTTITTNKVFPHKQDGSVSGKNCEHNKGSFYVQTSLKTSSRIKLNSQDTGSSQLTL